MTTVEHNNDRQNYKVANHVRDHMAEVHPKQFNIPRPLAISMIKRYSDSLRRQLGEAVAIGYCKDTIKMNSIGVRSPS